MFSQTDEITKEYISTLIDVILEDGKFIAIDNGDEQYEEIDGKGETSFEKRISNNKELIYEAVGNAEYDRIDIFKVNVRPMRKMQDFDKVGGIYIVYDEVIEDREEADELIVDYTDNELVNKYVDETNRRFSSK